MLKISTLALLVLLGCGSDPVTTTTAPRDALSGTSWLSNYTTACSLTADFGTDGSFRQHRVCADGAAFDGQTDAGTYAVDGDQLTRTTPATCASSPGGAVAFVLEANTLTLGDVVMYKTTPETVRAAEVVGCFDEAGAFTPAP